VRPELEAKYETIDINEINKAANAKNVLVEGEYVK
jgi:hypothetical protein